MELVTGRKGVAHITSQQDRMKHQGVFGEGAYILKTGQMLEPQVQSSNEIRIRDGALMVQGALGCVKVNTYDPVTIQNGTQGMKRIDLICWQYTYDAEQDVESAEWVVIQGTPAETDPQQPAYTDGDIQQGDSPVQVPVFAVELDGINVTGVTTLLPTAPTLEELNSKLQDTGWVNCSLGYGMSVLGERTPQVRRIGNVVHMRGRIVTSTQWTQHDSIVTIPDGFRPSQDEAFIQSSTGTYRYRIEVMKAGNVVANAITNNTNGNAETTAGYWFALSCTWFLE